MMRVTRRNFIRAGLAAAGQNACAPRLLPLTALVLPAATARVAAQATPDPFNTIHGRASVLLQQLKAGLDYYGYRQNYVPVLSISDFETSIATMVAAGKSLQTGLDGYQQNEADLQKKRTMLQDTVARAQTQLATIATEQVSLPEQQQQLGSQIEQLDQEHLAARSDVLAKVANLNASLHSNGCTVFQVIAIAGAVVSLVVTLGSDAPLIAAAASAAISGAAYAAPGQPPPPPVGGGFINQQKTRVADLKFVKGQFDDLANAYKSVQAAFPPAPVSGEVDAVKFLVEDGDFTTIRAQAEADIKNLPDTPEKRAYLVAMDHYLNVTEVRNQQLLAFDGLTYRLERLVSDRIAYNGTVATANGQLNQLSTTDPQAIIDTVNAMLGMLRKDVQFAIYQQVRAMDYWSLNHENGPSASPDFAITEGALGILADRKLRMLADVGGPPGSFTGTLQLQPTAGELQALVAQGSYTFYLTLDAPIFAHLNHVLVTQITVNFLDATGRPILPAGYSIEHSGFHEFLDKNGQRKSFTSVPRPVGRIVDQHNVASFYSDFATSGDASLTSALGNYVGVSPCTRWKLNVFSEYRPQLAALTALELVMTGGARVQA